MLIKLNELDAFINYKVWVKEDNTFTLIYIGTCRLNELLKMPDFQLCKSFREVIRPDDEFRLELLDGCYSTLNIALSVATVLIETFKPFCNLHSEFHEAIPRGAQVKCITDDTVYENAYKAAAAYGIDRGNMSAHLRGRRKSIAGRVFRYV